MSKCREKGDTTLGEKQVYVHRVSVKMNDIQIQWAPLELTVVVHVFQKGYCHKSCQQKDPAPPDSSLLIPTNTSKSAIKCN